MTANLHSDTTLRVADLRGDRAQPIQLALDNAALAAGRDQLGILDLAKVRFDGKLSPERKTDWRLTGRLGATVTQACVVTLAPVRTRLDITVDRLFTAQWQEPDPESETEMPEEVNIDPLPAVIDLAAVFFEEISLAMPDYPRADGVDHASASAAPDGTEPLSDEDLKPFAALKALKDRMEK